MKLPEDVHRLLARRFQNQCREWLASDAREKPWPLEIALGLPTEQAALRQIEGVRAWVEAWRHWQGAGTLSWSERRWKTLGLQRMPEKLTLQGPEALALWIGEAARWERASTRYRRLTAHWPALARALPKHFGVLADCGEADFRRLEAMLEWMARHPDSGLYPRQLPVPGLDSKWLDGRRALLADLAAAVQGEPSGDLDFYARCGLKAPPFLVRMRVLDGALRTRLGGLNDVSAPVEELAALDLPASHVFIVENLQTGLAMSDLPGAVVFIGLGYGVNVLARLPWLARAKCLYWGDLDTHGFAILNRARAHLPGLRSVLMDEGTLLCHRALWVEEKEQSHAAELTCLTEAEQAVYRNLKEQRWGQNVRLEQERIDWEMAWKELLGAQAESH